MEKIKNDLIKEICEEQNFDEILLQTLSNRKKNRINAILKSINKNDKIETNIKTQLYEEILEYVNDINELYKISIKEIFSKGAQEAIKKINSIYNNQIETIGDINKPFNNYEQVHNEEKRLEKEIEHKKYLEWNDKYYNIEIVNIDKLLTWKDKKILKNLGIKIKNKSYTENEIQCLMMELLAYYDNPELSEEEKQYQKSLKGTNVTRKNYNKILNKIEEITNING